MRYLIYLLAALNLFFLVWNVTQPPQESGDARALPPLPAGTRPIETLEELQAKEFADDISGVEQLTASKPPGAGQGMACRVLGPIAANWQVEAVAKRLGVSGFVARRRSSEIKVQTGYWIYLPAMERNDATRIVNLLDEANDREYFVGKDNVISLGAFVELSRAEVRLESARKHGLDPILEPTYENRRVHWLDLEIAPSREAELDTIIKEYPDIQVRNEGCP
jgi:hypothetical protein